MLHAGDYPLLTIHGNDGVGFAFWTMAAYRAPRREFAIEEDARPTPDPAVTMRVLAVPEDVLVLSRAKHFVFDWSEHTLLLIHCLTAEFWLYARRLKRVAITRPGT